MVHLQQVLIGKLDGGETTLNMDAVRESEDVVFDISTSAAVGGEKL